MALNIGDRIGGYEVVHAIGAGGMGEVYRARDTRLNRDVALKVLPENFSQDPDRRSRFEREAQLLAALNHSNIAAIYGIEETDGRQTLVMEFVDGPTLADRLGGGPLPIDEVIVVARQICEALEYAHEYLGSRLRDVRDVDGEASLRRRYRLRHACRRLARRASVERAATSHSPDRFLSHRHSESPLRPSRRDLQPGSELRRL